MAKENGLGMSVSCDDASGTPRDISNDVLNLDWATPRAVDDLTGVDKSAFERGLLLADFSGTLNMGFNDAVNRSHSVFKTVPSTSVPRTLAIVISGQDLTNEVLCTDYGFSRDNSGAVRTNVPFVLADGTVPAWS